MHQKAGVEPEAVVELHGNAHSIVCLQCAARFDRLMIHTRVEAGDEDPLCSQCGGILKTATVSFGQALPVSAVAAAQHLHATARVCLVIGSSLVVYPAATLPELTLDAGGQLAIVNHTPTHLDAFASFISRESAVVVLAATHTTLSRRSPTA